MLDAPLWKPPSLAPLSGLAELLAASRLELRCRWGKRERVRARHDCRTSTASVLGGFAPLPPAFPVRERLPVMHVWGASPPCPPRSPVGNVWRSCTVGGLRPRAPRGPRLGTVSGHARLGANAPLPPAFPVRGHLPIMRVSAWDNVRNGFAGNAFANLAEAPAA